MIPLPPKDCLGFPALFCRSLGERAGAFTDSGRMTRLVQRGPGRCVRLAILADIAPLPGIAVAIAIILRFGDTGCGLRRQEAAELDLAHLQQREDHWAIVDLVGKARPRAIRLLVHRIRTVILPAC